MHRGRDSKARKALTVVIPRESGVSSTLRLLDSIIDVSGILDHLLEPVIGRAFARPCFPSPREAAGRDQGWGVVQRTPLSANLPIDPPPPTPPRHALTRAEGGEKANSIFQTHLRILATQSARGLLASFASEIRGRRECRAPGAPAAACAKVEVESTRVSQVTPKTPGIPRAMVLRLISCSPRRSGSFATVASRILPRDLTPASRRQDHTTSPSASGALVRSTLRVHRIPPHVRDDRETPLYEAGRTWI
jgi:hypothetical protein